MEGTKFRMLASGEETTYDVVVHAHDGSEDMRLENLRGVFVIADGNEDGPTVYFRGSWVPSGCDSPLAWLRALSANIAIINHRIAGDEDYELDVSDIVYTLAAAAGLSPDDLREE